MKKFLATTLASLVLASLGLGFAQVTATARHDVTVTIPEVVMLRFTDGPSNAAVTTGLDLEFDLTEGFDATTDFDFAGDHPVSNAPGWDDLKVFVNRTGTWTVTVGLENVVVEDSSWNWGSIAVAPSGSGALAGAFTLADTNVASASVRGWSSLGFGPQDFTLTLDGTEVGGTYSATVVYTLTAP